MKPEQRGELVGIIKAVLAVGSTALAISVNGAAFGAPTDTLVAAAFSPQPEKPTFKNRKAVKKFLRRFPY